MRDLCRPLNCDQSCEATQVVYANNTVDYQAFCVCDLKYMKIRVAGGFRCTNLNECNYNNGDCEQLCTDLSVGHRCSCQRGFMLETNMKSCTRITGSWCCPSYPLLSYFISHSFFDQLRIIYFLTLQWFNFFNPFFQTLL